MMMNNLPELMKFYKGKKVFVTGDTGFKGTWLCKLLTMAQAEVTGYALPSASKETADVFRWSGVAGRIRHIDGDVRDYTALKNAFETAAPEIVFHLAAQPLVLKSYENPLETYAVNVMGTANLLECARHSKSVRSLLNVTTDKVYENNEWCWGYRETDVLNGYDPYSNSKSCSELVTSSYRKSLLHPVGIAVSTARAGNVIGGGDFAENRIIPDCIRAATSGREIAIRSPHSVRPYQHVLEPLSAYLLLAARQMDNPELSGCYNIGPDDTDCTTTEKLVQLFCRAWGYGATWRCINAVQPHEANFLKLDCSRIKAVLGWQPHWHIEEAVQHTVAWAKAYYAGDNIAGLMEDQIREFGFGEVDRI